MSNKYLANRVLHCNFLKIFSNTWFFRYLYDFAQPHYNVLIQRGLSINTPEYLATQHFLLPKKYIANRIHLLFCYLVLNEHLCATTQTAQDLELMYTF